MVERPLGVTIIGILWILSGFFVLVLGAISGAVLTVILGAFGVAAGGIMVILGLVNLALGIGCFKGWPWVWTVGVILTALDLILGIGGLLFSGGVSIIGLIIAAVILYYLFQPNVKAWFGKV